MLSTNYRPISVLSAINNVFESLFAKRLNSFLKSMNILYGQQYGFREASSTATAVLEVMDFVYGALDRRDCGVVSALLIDLRNAFDLVDHALLLEKLHRIGVRGPAHYLLTDYLSGRQQYVRIRDKSSTHRLVTSGVPQGSVIGPILFLIFLNDLSRLPLFGKLFLYADDALLAYDGADDDVNSRRMNEDLEMLHDYLSRNRLALNIDKTKYLHFHDPRKQLSGRVSVSLFDDAVERVDEFCYLGVYLDSHLTWKRHVDHLSQKLSRLIGVIYRVRDEIPFYALKRLYFGLAHSHLMNMVSLWGNAPATSLKRLQTLQNRILKIIYRKPILTPTVTLFSEHVKDVLPVKGMQILVICKFVKQSLQGSIHRNVLFPQQSGIENNRDSYKLSRVRAFTGWGLQRISFQGPTFFNSLPPQIRQIQGIPRFVHELKSYLLHPQNLVSLLRFELP